MSFVKDFFWDFPMSVWSEGFFGKFMALLFMSIIGFALWLFVGFIFELADTSGLDYKKGAGVVQSKKFDPAHTVHWSTTTMVGKVPITTPHVTHYPDRYFVDIEINSKLDTVQVSLAKFEKVNVSDEVEVMYSQNRFTNGVTISSFN